ncbi:hypothetical protein ACFWF7_12095 [Nocardia sp. NPDC060256]|uniref:hypothetical protein n=1 Tax=unclassified Nocardia TaxID=2637762 RepID=UPI00364AD36D
MRRRIIGIAAAGALVALPLGAFAATASAEAPAPDATIQVQAANGDVDQQGADINRPHHKHRPGGPHRGHHPHPDGAPQLQQQFQQLLPPTGSG